MNKMITNFYGYIDPGSGSAIAAIIISAIVGLGMTFKLYWVKLKDKVSKGMPTSDILFQKDNTIKQESLSALLALGFTKKGAEQKIDTVLKENPEITSVEDLVKMALSQM